MVGDQIRNPGEVDTGDAVLDLRKILSGCNSEQCGHRCTCVLGGDDGCAAVDGRGRDGQANANLFAGGQRNCQLDDIGIVHGQRRTGLRMRSHHLGLDDPFGWITEACNGVLRHTRSPVDIRRGQHDAEQSGSDLRVSTAGDADGLDTACDEFVGGGLLEAVEQISDRLVDLGDACHGDGAGDDADLVGGVTRIVCLPQGVTAPPATDIAVDDGDEVDGLARQLAQRGEERDVGRVQHDICGVRELSEQRTKGCAGPLERLYVGEQCRDRSTVDRVQTCLGALKHVEEALAPGDVEPHRFASRGHVLGELTAAVEFAVSISTDGQVEVTREPLLVGHLGDIAEVRLRGSVERGDDLIAPLRYGVGISGDLVEQAAAA